MVGRDVIELDLPDAPATRELGAALARCARGTAAVALIGPLGAGKTTLVQGAGEELGIKEPVSSPTFTMLNEYHSGAVPLYHVDLYRLEGEGGGRAYLSEEELEHFQAELSEIMSSPGLVFVEWAELLPGLLPGDSLQVVISYSHEGERRTARLAAGGAQSRRLLTEVAAILISR